MATKWIILKEKSHTSGPEASLTEVGLAADLLTKYNAAVAGLTGPTIKHYQVNSDKINHVVYHYLIVDYT